MGALRLIVECLIAATVLPVPRAQSDQNLLFCAHL